MWPMACKRKFFSTVGMRETDTNKILNTLFTLNLSVMQSWRANSHTSCRQTDTKGWRLRRDLEQDMGHSQEHQWSLVSGTNQRDWGLFEVEETRWERFGCQQLKRMCFLIQCTVCHCCLGHFCRRSNMWVYSYNDALYRLSANDYWFSVLQPETLFGHYPFSSLIAPEKNAFSVPVAACLSLCVCRRNGWGETSFSVQEISRALLPYLWSATPSLWRQ